MVHVRSYSPKGCALTMREKGKRRKGFVKASTLYNINTSGGNCPNWSQLVPIVL